MRSKLQFILALIITPVLLMLYILGSIFVGMWYGVSKEFRENVSKNAPAYKQAIVDAYRKI